jgi:hypothetical protein
MSGNWFVPSASPSVDLQQGAMNIIGGAVNKRAQTFTDKTDLNLLDESDLQ